MNRKKLLYQLLKKIEEGNNELTHDKFGLTENDFHELSSLASNEGYVSNIRWYDDQPSFQLARITMKGIEFLEEINSSTNDIRQLILAILTGIKSGSKELHSTNFSISKDEYGDVVEMMLSDGLISEAVVQRGGQGNKVVYVVVENAKLTIKGLGYLETHSNNSTVKEEELSDEELEEQILSICYHNRGDRKKNTVYRIRKELSVRVHRNRIEWMANNLISKKYIRKQKNPSYKGLDGKLTPGDIYYEITTEGISLFNNVMGIANDLGVDSNMSNKVFIIHGHDNEMKSQVQLFLNRAKMDDVVLHERVDKGRTIIDKLIEESMGAVYVIALMSPDDVLDSGAYRARQNVILEIGYFIGKIGKERVRILKKDNIEMPSDLAGILYENYDAAGAWKIKLLKEMRAVGIDVDIDGVMARH